MNPGGNKTAGISPWALILAKPSGLADFLELQGTAGEEPLEGTEVFAGIRGEGPLDLKAMARTLERMEEGNFNAWVQWAQRSLDERGIPFASGPEVVARVKAELLRRRVVSDPLVRLAKASAIAKNQLLRWEHVAYQMAWKQQINPDSKPQSWIYGGIGADLATILLATDATRVRGFDSVAFDAGQFRFWLANWETVVAGRNPFVKDLNQVMERRWQNGYWEESNLDLWSRERCAVAELKRMGVDPATIQIRSLSPSVLKVEFDWAYPGKEMRRREFVFSQTFIDLTSETPGFLSEGLADGYYLKSVPIMEYLFINHVIRVTRLAEPAFIIFGDQSTLDLGRPVVSLSGLPYEPVAVDPAYEPLLKGVFRDSVSGSDGGYGWRLYGARRKSQ